MTSIQLKIILKAVKIRLSQGEELGDILRSYTKLTDKDVEKIKQEI